MGSLIVCYTLFCCYCLSSSMLFAQPFQKEKFFSVHEVELLEQVAHAENVSLKRNQIALDSGGRLNHSLSYARRVGNTNLSIGGGLGFAWELNTHSFERNIWEALHVTIFGRYQLPPVLQVDVGPILFAYVWTDDCSECAGTFVGLHTVALVGYRYLFFGPWIRVGWADDNRHGSEFGSIWGLQTRLAIPWGQ